MKTVRVAIAQAAIAIGSLSAGMIQSSALALPKPLPYAIEGPFIPTLDLFGSDGQGLILGAQEILSEKPAPLTIGNTTFIPEYTNKKGKTFGGYTLMNGDLQVINGDLYLGNKSVNKTLKGLENDSAAYRIELDAHTLDIQTNTQTLLNHDSRLQSQDARLQSQDNLLQQHSSSIQSLNQELTTTNQNVHALGVGVAGATALSTALTALPVDSDESPAACGLGTGGYSSRFAMAVGCALRVSNSVSINAGGSYVFGGSSNYGSGTLSNFAARAGVVYRFGGPPPSKDQAQASTKVQADLALSRKENQALAAELTTLRQRLDKLEALASASR